jgi:putative membrane-bound dehydrogenase-like protein
MVASSINGADPFAGWMKRTFIGAVLWIEAISCAAADQPLTGPATESRFPPLKVPAGFTATLFACDPLIEYPSVIAAGPRPGALFVAVDYMTGLGLEIVRRSEVRLVEDTNGDGYADKATVYADGFNSIMGLAYHDGILFVMHSPFLTALRDTQETGVADERTDIVVGLGLRPEDNPERLHCANGVTVGHDGWLYLALGDHGCDVKRPEGDRLILEGGGILRCRLDGSDLHVFATGLRNIYDVALDAELNVFVRDNENDGGAYKIRVCHSFFGADHGYPYLYYERPNEALPPLADLGLGSSAGGVCYLERHFPDEYRGNVFFCEWGKSLVRYPLRRDGSSFARPQETEYAAGRNGDPYGFQPTDVIVQRDGTLMVSDYADGQRPKRGRGRIYHIAHLGDAEQWASDGPSDPFAMLDSESYFERCEAQATIETAGEKGLVELIDALAEGRIDPRGRLHAIWILVHGRGAQAIEPLLAIVSSDPEPSVRAQAVRAIADLADPLLARHRLDAGPGDMALAARLAALAQGQDRRVELEVIIALGRLRWPGTAEWLSANLTMPDAALSHAAMQALRQAGDWPAVLDLLDAPEHDPVRGIALRAAARQYDAELIDGLLQKLFSDTDANRLSEYADWLARVHRKPGPWVYWGWQPKPRPPNPVSWERTEKIEDALNQMLAHRDPRTRLAVLQSMRREQVPANPQALGQWLQEDIEPERVAAVLDVLRDHPAADVHKYLDTVIRNPLQTSANRLAALALFVQGRDEKHSDALISLSRELEDGPVLAELLRQLGRFSAIRSAPVLVSKLVSAEPEVRASAIETLGELRAVDGRARLLELLADQDPLVRRAAARAAGQLEERRAIEPLLELASESDPLVRAASLESLCLLKEPRAVPLFVAALADRQTGLNALEALRDLGGPEQAAAVVDLAQGNPSLDVLRTAVDVLTNWRERPGTSASQQQDLDRAVAEIHGASGSLVRWDLSGPIAIRTDIPANSIEATDTRTQFAVGTEGRIVIAPSGIEQGHSFEARTEIAVTDETEVEFLASTSSTLQIWLNGTSILSRETPQDFHVDSERFSATLSKGNNRLVVWVGVAATESPVEFHLRFRRKSTIAEHERLAEAALVRPGNPEHGRKVFANVEKSLCLKCHRLRDQGEHIGPDLTGVGSRFSRIYIAESILQPSRTVAPSFGAVILQLESGRVLSGVKVVEDEITLTLADDQGQKQLVLRHSIEDEIASDVSPMPEGLEKRLTEQEFVDLVAFLAGETETGPLPVKLTPFSPTSGLRFPLAGEAIVSVGNNGFSCSRPRPSESAVFRQFGSQRVVDPARPPPISLPLARRVRPNGTCAPVARGKSRDRGGKIVVRKLASRSTGAARAARKVDDLSVSTRRTESDCAVRSEAGARRAAWRKISRRNPAAESHPGRQRVGCAVQVPPLW